MRKGKKKTERQKEQDRKGKERMSYYMRKKLEREQAKKDAFNEKAKDGIECFQKIVDKDGFGAWKCITWVPC